ncbi:carboxylesterase/lipase family protein [Gordonia soli]|uniref:Carboxylic ester hydrolase n=1 Tax=Gordonia soli NBRC 108243 TaxID=1223545 RepID=M0QQB6_9ACTN|nr:carboxylesterase/lipase family protein [Gordonia soli]GAC70594.1 putative carboxylesterase [Gordonia soli NBRC 108243]
MTSADDLLVTTSYGPVRGRTVTSADRPGSGPADAVDIPVDVWKGIPYAAPPVGDLRWRRARPPVAHTEVLEASDYGPASPQERNPAIRLGEGVRFDEDCLVLNVWAPHRSALATPAALPVLVWLHGGAYVFGSASQPLYDASRMVAANDVVVVTVNYRVGALGFADLRSAAAGSDAVPDDRFESNAALSDVLLALRWVRDEIGAFGGDAANVTLFGESAGGGLVTTLLTVPAAAGLFDRAIAQSSPATSLYDSERAAVVGDRLIRALGVEGRPELLEAVGTDALIHATMTVFTDVPAEVPGTIAFAPVVDGDLVPEHPLDAFRAGRSHPVPLMIGTNKDEAALFKWMKSPLMPITPGDIERMFAGMAAEYPDVTLPERATVAAAYAGLRPKVAGLGVARDIAFRMPTVWLAEAHSRVAPVYLYRFDWAPMMLRALRIGATHATELPYVWGNLVAGPRDITFKLGGRRVGEQLSVRTQRRWIAFARNGDPSYGEQPWPSFTTDERSTLVIDSDDRIVDDLDAELRSTWGDDVLSFR